MMRNLKRIERLEGQNHGTQVVPTVIWMMVEGNVQTGLTEKPIVACVPGYGQFWREEDETEEAFRARVEAIRDNTGAIGK